ncbi:hypothetical protein [Nigerium massiliense]|uniref:hypothetical protein n=1 Tax=Nigerium massiliense TaxID=1522317 RepID=UPI00058C143C|nr:hypothetical protein [Nigerium massiliense]
MPETRKHHTTSTDPITLAVREAIGGDVRPQQPGAEQEHAGDDAPKRPSERGTLPSSTLGAFTFSAAPKPKPRGE